MKRILKYQLDFKKLMSGQGQRVKLVKTASILTVQEQSGSLVMWAVIDDDDMPQEVSFFIYPTGEALPDQHGSYVTTVQLANGMVFHVFIKANALVHYLPC